MKKTHQSPCWAVRRQGLLVSCPLQTRACPGSFAIFLPRTQPEKEKVQGGKKWTGCPKLTGSRHFKNLCKVPSPSPASPHFQRKLCLLELLQPKERRSTKSRTWYEIRAISSEVAERSLPLHKCAALEDAVITSVGENAAGWQSPPAKYAFLLTFTILNFVLRFATPVLFSQPVWLCVYVAKTQSKLFPEFSHPPRPCPWLLSLLVYI